MILLLLMAAVGAALFTFSEREKALTDAALKRAAASQAATNAARLALAELQLRAGKDSASTAPDGENPWCAVRAGAEPDEAQAPARTPALPVPLVSRGSEQNGGEASFPDPKSPGGRVRAPWKYVGDGLRVAYFVVDESEKFPLRDDRADPAENPADARAEQRRRQLVGAPAAALKAFPRNASGTGVPPLLKARYDPALFFAENSGRGTDRGTTALRTLGVVADWPRNALKKDLSKEDAAPELFAARAPAARTEALSQGVPAATAEAKPDAGGLGLLEHFCPLVADLRLHVGFFNPRTDGQHRARFHVTAKLWNPYAFPLLAHADGQFGMIDFSVLPTISVTNRNTGAGFSAALSDFPTGRFGLVRQTQSDRTFNAYCRIFDASDQGFGTDRKSPETGLHAGEIYTARFPDPSGQPEGLSRITGGATWKFQKGADPNKPPSGAVDGRWFHDEHAIEFFSIPPLFPGEIALRHYNGSFRQTTDPRDYAPPIFRFANVSFPYVQFTLTGREYNRQKAGDHDAARANLVYRIRLRTEDENALKNLLESVDLRDAVFDFADPVVAAAFEVSAHVGEAAKTLAEAEDDENETYFFDRYVNAHRTEERAPAFASIQLYDLPEGDGAPSASALRFPHLTKIPPLALGRFDENVAKLKINQIFDRYFFSSQKRGENAVTSDDPLFVRKDRTMCPPAFSSACPVDFAEECMTDGPFNVNSTNEKAWAALLSNAFEKWEQYSGRAGELRMPWDTPRPKKDFDNAFFMRPFSAQFFSPDGKVFPLSDKELEEAPWRSRDHFLLSQGLRGVPEEKIARMAKNVADENRERLAAGRHFASVAEFADSGVLHRAIERAEINTLAGKKIPAWFPGFLRQEHVLQNVARRLAPRGDTFTIYAQAEILNPLTGRPEARATAEMLVQRFPEFFDASQRPNTPYGQCGAVNRCFGRRFRIVHFRYGIE
ncbi:MAG: hypothetical protein ACI4QA_06855 [Candidatus Spyradosoma sp.]